MTYYFHGDPIVPKFGHSLADRMTELGVPDAQRSELIGWAAQQGCCKEFDEVFYDLSEEVLDFGTEERIGIEVLLPSIPDSNAEIKDHRWATFRYCPFCGMDFRCRRKG